MKVNYFRNCRMCGMLFIKYSKKATHVGLGLCKPCYKRFYETFTDPEKEEFRKTYREEVKLIIKTREYNCAYCGKPVTLQERIETEGVETEVFHNRCWYKAMDSLNDEQGKMPEKI